MSAAAREFEAEARRRLEPAYYDFFAGGAGDEITTRANEAAWERLAAVPEGRSAAGVPRGHSPAATPDGQPMVAVPEPPIVTGSSAGPQVGLSRENPQVTVSREDPHVTVSRERPRAGAATGLVTLPGTPPAPPVVIAPTAFHRLAHPEGERATARAAEAAGTIMIVSMAATVAVGAIAAAAPGAALWFQLYVQPDPAFTETVVRRAEAAGCRALVVTVDSPALGRRDRDARNGFHDLPDGLRCENLRDGDVVRPIAMCPGLSWRHLAGLREMTELPVVVKGITHPADARLAVEHGAAAVIVSNHGGRQLDTVPPTAGLLPGIAAAVGGAVPVLVDGGLRRSAHVREALARGATAVAVGRPILWGLAAAGEAGVRRVLDLLRPGVPEAVAAC